MIDNNMSDDNDSSYVGDGNDAGHITKVFFVLFSLFFFVFFLFFSILFVNFILLLDAHLFIYFVDNAQLPQ